MGLCVSQDELDKSVNKFGARRSSQSGGNCNDVPQLYSGRIYPVLHKLRGPASGKECVYYETKATTKSGGITSSDQKALVKYHSLETKQVDFIISDNPANPLSSWIYVPASFFASKVNGAKSYQMKLEREVSVFPSNVETLLQKSNLANDEHSLMYSLNHKQLVFMDEVLELGQTVAILGIIKEVLLFSGDIVRVLTPVSTANLTDEFYRVHSWSAQDKERFMEMTGATPTFLITGKNQHFTEPSSSHTADSVEFPGLDEVRASYKARYLPFYVEEEGGEEVTGDDTPAGRLTHISAPPADYHVTHTNVHSAPHVNTGLPPSHGHGHYQNNQQHNQQPHGHAQEEEHTARMHFRPPPKEHADNQQDFEDTIRTRQ